MPKILEHFRHAVRTKPSPHLNEIGVKTARKLGEKYGPYDLVISSPKWRAVETAVAMGFPVHETVDFFEDIPEKVNDLVPYDAGFKAFYDGLISNTEIQKYVARMKKEIQTLLEKLPKDGKLLITSHGGVVEWSSMAFIADEASRWGESLDKCEGVRLEFHSSGKITGKPLRL